MTLFAVLLEDDPEQAAELRRRYMPAHLDFLDRHAARIRAAGPLFDPNSEQTDGGLWLVTAEDADAVRDLLHRDPFWSAGLRRAVRICEWRRVFAAGRRV